MSFVYIWCLKGQEAEFGGRGLCQSPGGSNLGVLWGEISLDQGPLRSNVQLGALNPSTPISSPI